MKFLIQINNCLCIQVGSWETGGFDKVIATLVLNICNFYLYRKEGTIKLHSTYFFNSEITKMTAAFMKHILDLFLGNILLLNPVMIDIRRNHFHVPRRNFSHSTFHVGVK